MRKLENTEEIKTLKDLEIDGANQTHNRKQYILDALTKVIYWAIITVPIFAAICIIIAAIYYLLKDFQIFTNYLIELIKAIFFVFLGYLVSNKIIEK